MKNLLIDRYPLVFSPGYYDKLQSLSQCIPTISKSLTRIIYNSPNEAFQSRTTDLVQQTRNRTNLSFLPYGCDNLNTELTPESTTYALANGLYFIARKIKVPTLSFTEFTLGDKELSDDHPISKDAAKSILNQGPSCIHERENSQIECSIDIDNEEYEQFAKEMSPDTESTFDIDDEDQQDLEEVEFESLLSSDDDFWQDEDLSHINGIQNRTMLNPPEISVDDVDYCKNSDLSDARVVPDDDDDGDLLDFDAFEDDMYFCPNTADSWNLSSLGCCEVNNSVMMIPQIRNLTNEINNTDMSNNSTNTTLLWQNDPEDAFSDTMFEE